MSMNVVTQLTSAEGMVNPYPIYRALRAQNPVVWVDEGQSGEGWWLVTQYDLADAILKDPRVWKDASRMGFQNEDSFFGNSMLFQDPPKHTRLRSLVNRAFTPRLISRLEPRIIAIVDGLLDHIGEQKDVDFMSAFAMPLPVTVIAEVLGIPVEDRQQFREWSRLIIGTDDEPVEESIKATKQLGGYFDELIRRRRKAPGEDLLSDLTALQEAGDRLSHQELLGMCVLLLVAGHETTVNLMGNGLYALLQNPGQLGRLRQDPALIESAVEEMLRYDAPVQWGTFRFAGESISIGGCDIGAGQTVVVALSAANRDPAQFADPDTFDVSRSPNRHLSFGMGIHFCLGAPLARLEARVSWSRLLPRFGQIDLNGTPRRRPNVAFRGFDSLPTRFFAG